MDSLLSLQVSMEVLTTYQKKFSKNYKSKTATEPTYYADFKELLEKIFPSDKGFHIQIEPKVTGEFNKPDFSVYMHDVLLFYIEGKLPFSSISDMILTNDGSRLKDQALRYTEKGQQLLITDFTKIWVVQRNEDNVELNDSIVCSILCKSKDKIQVFKSAVSEIQNILHYICDENIKTISNIQNLIHPLSRIAQTIREKTFFLFKTPDLKLTPQQRIASKFLIKVKDDFKSSLFKEEVDDTIELFADLYAQTIIYATFSAWLKFCQEGRNLKRFSINTVENYLPFGSFLRNLFLRLKNQTPKEFIEIFDRIENIFQSVDFKPMKGNIESLLSLFYSDFLKLYDPKTAKDRGVVYTPNDIVEYIIKGIDYMIIKWLNKPDGIISTSNQEILKDSKKKSKKKTVQIPLTPKPRRINRLKILDPASGTMAFSSGFLNVAFEKFLHKNPRHAFALDDFETWVKEEFFENMHAFEILMAPYVLGHMRVFLTLENLGLKSIQPVEFRLKSYLMNTLMTPEQKLDSWFFNNPEIQKEIIEAIRIRDSRNIFIIMGNPPYNVSSQNDCEWINEKIMDYKKGLNEKNLKILSDDYVKFIRFAQWKIEKVGKGIVGYITNNKYLDGQMFSVMRNTLRKTFDHIYIINFHGDMRKGESGNLFGIRVGVAIVLMVRIDDNPDKKATIHYTDVPSNKIEEKFNFLRKGFEPEDFEILPETPKNYFIKMDITFMEKYNRFIPINNFFRKSPLSGIMAGKDKLVINLDKNILKDNLKMFFSKEFEKLEQRKIRTNDTQTWTKKKVLENTSFKDCVKSIQKIRYRGFDYRHITYDRAILEGHRMGYLDQISESNLGLTVSKSSRRKEFCTAFVSDSLVEKCYMSVVDTAYVFLLEFDNKENIIIPKTLPYHKEITAFQLFTYIYGILFAREYRKRYNSFLLKEFPKIPLTKNLKTFTKMSDSGKELIDQHLLKNNIMPRFTISDLELEKWFIKKISYKKEEERVYLDTIPDLNYLHSVPWIGGITKEMWDYSIGNIPQLENFLKSRKFTNQTGKKGLNRGLNREELTYFLKMCSSILKCLDIEDQINILYFEIDP